MREGASSTPNSPTGGDISAEFAKLAKFGGACVSEPDMYRRIAALIRDDATRRFLVVSAISSVTDSLLAAVSKPRAEKEIDSFVAAMSKAVR